MGILVSALSTLLKIGFFPIFCLVFSFFTLFNYWKKRRTIKMMERVPGLPTGLPFFGNAIELNVNHDEVFTRITSTRMLWGRRSGLCKAWIGSRPYVCISKASAVEVILNSSKYIDKSDDYNYLRPWLGMGLLTSTGRDWHKRRKILTPAFHFKILDDFLGIFVEQSHILNRKLLDEVGRGPFNIFPYVTGCTLDIISETAMGCNVQAQTCTNSEYVQAVYKISSIIQNRQSKLWLQPDWTFKLSASYKEHEKCLQMLHKFSMTVIKQRKETYTVTQQPNAKRKRLAFLDLLLEASNGGKLLSDEDIREEVDTFMFEGHDTTSAALCWTLFLLGSNPEIQEKAYDEVFQIFRNNDRAPTINDVAKMKFVGCCIKEALRLYPSVPIFARKLNEDVNVEGYDIPCGTTAMIVAYQLHRDPDQFVNPEVYDPTRFVNKSPGLHPYAYIPFSAGPRNCIGQKFALMEMKVIVSQILRKFKITSIDRREDLILLGELILRPKNGLKMQLESRINS